MENSTIPRRCDIEKNEPAEIAILKAIEAVENEGAHEMLTDVVTKLAEAKELLGDYIDTVKPKDS